MATTKALIPTELQGRGVGTAVYTFDEIYRIAQACHASGLFADTKDASQALVKILKGQELGLPPTSAMNAFDIVQNRIFVKPWALGAKINSCGYGMYRVEEQTPERCTIVFSRKYHGKGWQDCPAVTYTIQEATAHGLTNRSAHWKHSSAHMLYQRCLGRGGAMYFPELLAGLEMPQDDTPIAPERHQQNLSDLFGDGTDTSTPQPEGTNHERGTSRFKTSPATPTKTLSQEENGNLGHSEPKNGHTQNDIAFDTLEAHRDDARLPHDLLDRIAAALSPLAHASVSEAHALSSEVLDYLNGLEE